MTTKETIELYHLLKEVNEQKNNSFIYDIQNGYQTIQIFVETSDWGYWNLWMESDSIASEDFDSSEETIISVLDGVRKHKILYY